MIKLPQMDPKVIKYQIMGFIQRKVEKMGKDGIAIGISGGVDSAVCAVLSKLAMYDIRKHMVGYILPGDSKEENIMDNSDAVELCEKFSITPIHRSLKPVINVAEKGFGSLNKTALGNMSSRLRATILHTYAEMHNLLVCGTGNRDEDYGIGYYTLFGDGAVHISPIGKLSKRLVYQMAEYLEIPESIIQKTPSARLEEGQTDFGDLGYGYDMVEVVTEGLDQGYWSSYITREIEKMNLTYNKDKFPSVSACVVDILARHDMALKKAQLVSPEIAEVTLI